MNDKRHEELLRALEIISGCTPPMPKSSDDVPTLCFFRMKNLAALALASPEMLNAFYKNLETEGWILPLPYHSIKQIE